MSWRDHNFFLSINIPQQKSYDKQTIFPTVLSPNTEASVSALTAAIKADKAWLESLLKETGAVLLRGFQVGSASEFNDVVEAFGYEELPYVGGIAPRSNVVGRVFTASELPPDHQVAFHHEMAYNKDASIHANKQPAFKHHVRAKAGDEYKFAHVCGIHTPKVTKFPSKLFFFCEVEPQKGGETPIVLSHIVYERMKDKHPEFLHMLEEKGLIYTRVLGEDFDPTLYTGLGWKASFLADDRRVAEERAAELGIKLEWLEHGVKTITGPIPAIKVDESRNRKIWFNNIVAAYTGPKDKHSDFVKAVTYGDGTTLPDEIIHDCLKILDEESVVIPWQKGDVLLLDNLAVLHARRAFDPPRRVLASLCK